MKFDKQEHKDLVIQLLQQATYPGALVELAAELKAAAAAGEVGCKTADTAPEPTP